MHKINSRMIRQKRKKLNLSQEDVASKIGVSKVTICWYESGERIPSLENFLKLADALDLSLDEIVGREVSVVCEEKEKYIVHLPKRDLEIINSLKKSPNIYNKLYENPSRTIKLIERRIK